MNDFSYDKNINIRRFQNLLETSVDTYERQTIRKLLSEEKAKITAPPPEPKNE